MNSLDHKKLGEKIGIIASVAVILVLAALVYLFLWLGGYIAKEETIINKDKAEIPRQVTPEIPKERIRIIEPGKG